MQVSSSGSIEHLSWLIRSRLRESSYLENSRPETVNGGERAAMVMHQSMASRISLLRNRMHVHHTSGLTHFVNTEERIR